MHKVRTIDLFILIAHGFVFYTSLAVAIIVAKNHNITLDTIAIIAAWGLIIHSICRVAINLQNLKIYTPEEWRAKWQIDP